MGPGQLFLVLPGSWAKCFCCLVAGVLSILEILVSLVSLYLFDKIGKSILLKWWKSRHRDAKWFFWRWC